MNNKLGELIIHIAEKCETDPRFGATKLNKILFAADFFYFAYTGKSISDAKYIHKTNGPVPEDIAETKEKLIEESRIEEFEANYFGYTQKRIKPNVGADLSMFSENEISYVNEWVDYFWNNNGTQLSDWTHTLIPWLVTNEGQEIPYESVFMLFNRPVEKDGIEWAKKELEQFSHS